MKKGDLVIIYLPMIPEAFFLLHAVVRLGAIHSVVFGGFAAEELATRIEHAKPSLVITASCGIEMDKILKYAPVVDKALDLAGMPETKRLIV